MYETRLTGSFRRTQINNLFSGSGSFSGAEPDSFDVLVVDEAHRLNEKSGLYGNLGENQIKEADEFRRSLLMQTLSDYKGKWWEHVILGPVMAAVLLAVGIAFSFLLLTVAYWLMRMLALMGLSLAVRNANRFNTLPGDRSFTDWNLRSRLMF